MKTNLIYSEILKIHSSQIVSAEIEEYEKDTNISASIYFENGRTLVITQNTDENCFQNNVKMFESDGNQVLLLKTTDNFKIQDIVELVK